MKTDMKNGNEKIPGHDACAGIYIHIPFCVKKCAYCDFLSAPASESVKDAYVEALKRELMQVLKRMKTQKECISTVYFGGGTPSILKGGQIQEIMNCIRKNGVMEEHPEITLEMNPGTVTPEKLEMLRLAGINRLSIGIQSFHDPELKLLGRIHRAEDAFRCYEQARKAGFDNISLDLMSCLPGQSEKDWEENLKTAIRLNPEHISAYSLIIEENTEFYDRYGENWSEEQEDLDRKMYEMTGFMLKDAGYQRYEISNYAKTGFQSRHNSSYWKGIPYYGCGLGASSLVKDHGVYRRFHETTDLRQYLQASFADWNCLGETCLKEAETDRKEEIIKEGIIFEEMEILSEKSRMEEFMFLGLRMTEGISSNEFFRRFCCLPEDIFSSPIEELLEASLLIKTAEGYKLTEKGLDLSNYCFSKFLL